MKLLKIFLLACIAMITSMYAAEGSRSNILWHNSATGAISLLEINNMASGDIVNVIPSSNTNLIPRDFGDFTDDGVPDILLHNQNSGNLRIWEMDGAARVANILVLGSSNTNLKIAGVGDFDGDGDSDIAVFNTNSGALRIWVMRGTVRIENVLVLSGANTNLVPSGVGDMDGDDIPDIILRNNNTGTVRVWTMNNNFTRKSNQSVIGSSNTNLEIRGVVDINNDGNNDILNYNTNTGVLRAWLMDGNLGILDNASIAQVENLNWSVRSGTNYQYNYPDKPLGSAKPYIDVVVDDKVVDFGRLDSWRRNNPIGSPPNNHPDPFNLGTLIPSWGVYTAPPIPGPPPPAVQGNPTASTDLKRLPTIPAPGTDEHFNPIQYPDGMTLVYAIVANADGNPINAEFVLPVPIMGKGNFYTAIDLDMEGGVPAGTLIDSYETLTAYNDMLTRYANLGWLSIQPHQVNPVSVLPYAPPIAGTFASTIEPTALTVYPLDNLQNPVTFIKKPKEFPYIIGFNGGFEKISVGDIVTEATNPAELTPQGRVYKVSLVGGSWTKGNAKGYLWMIPVLSNFWDWRHSDAAIPTLLLGGERAAIVSYVGQALPIIWEAPDDPDVEQTTHDRRHINSDAIPRGGVINIEARVTSESSPQQKVFDWVAYPTEIFADCHDVDKDGYFAETGCKTEVDCNDENPEINPGATEICDDQKDNDCNGKIDCSDTACKGDTACCNDIDGDGYFAEADCGTKVDCNDENSEIHPGATEICDDQKDNDCNGKIDCLDTACKYDTVCIPEEKIWRLVETKVLEDTYEVTQENFCLESTRGEIIRLSGNSINFHHYQLSKACSGNWDIQGTINFETPPSYARPGEQVTLSTNGTVSGYQSCCYLGKWFNYYTEAGSLTVSPEYIYLDLKTLENTQVYYPYSDRTGSGWKGTVSDQATHTFTFPESYVNEFWLTGRGDRGIGVSWRYEYQE